MNENSFHQSFKKMMAAYNKGDKDLVIGYAYSLFNGNPENKYPEESEEHNLFELIKLTYPSATGYEVGNKFATRKMNKMILEFCALKPKNLFSYDKELAAQDAAAEKQAEKERIKAIEERELKEAEEEAERIVRYEQEQTKLKAQREANRIAEEKQRKEQQAKHDQLVQEMVKKKRIELKEKEEEEVIKPVIPDQNAYIFGVVPETKNWFRNLFKRRNKDDSP